jgi:hypothetical protein
MRQMRWSGLIHWGWLAIKLIAERGKSFKINKRSQVVMRIHGMELIQPEQNKSIGLLQVFLLTIHVQEDHAQLIRHDL